MTLYILELARTTITSEKLITNCNIWCAGSRGLLKLHEDVQTCDYKDVQVMFEMLTSELEAQKQQQQLLPPSPRKPAWPGSSPSPAPAKQ